MANYPQGVDMAAAIAAGFILDRREAVPALIGRHEDFLFVTGLAGTARDIAALTHDGALATIAVLNPANLAILCVDNGHYGETGYQKSHTSLGVDLEKIAIGCGLTRTRTVSREADLA